VLHSTNDVFEVIFIQTRCKCQKYLSAHSAWESVHGLPQIALKSSDLARTDWKGYQSIGCTQINAREDLGRYSGVRSFPSFLDECAIVIYSRGTMSSHLRRIATPRTHQAGNVREALFCGSRNNGLNKSIGVESDMTSGTNGRRGSIKIGVEIWLVAYRFYGCRKKRHHPWKIARAPADQRRVQSIVFPRIRRERSSVATHYASDNRARSNHIAKPFSKS
jgi:hypothetical protein